MTTRMRDFEKALTIAYGFLLNKVPDFCSEKKIFTNPNGHVITRYRSYNIYEREGFIIINCWYYVNGFHKKIYSFKKEM